MRCLKARTRLNAMAPQDGPRAFRLSVNDFIIKALAMALQQTPRANATWTEEGILLHRGSDIAVAVALPGGGLFTPVVRNAELKSLSEISNEMRDLAPRARSKGSHRMNIRAAPPRSPISACTASPSSTR